MELFGGNGFMEDFAVSRLHREALVTAIWEGATNIQALDMLEAMHKKNAHEDFLDEILPILKRAGTPEADRARQRLQETLTQLASLAADDAQWFSKDALRTLADVAQVALLYDLAQPAGERYAKLATLYARRFIEHEPYPAWALRDREVWWPLRE